VYKIEIDDVDANRDKFEQLHKGPTVSSSEIATVCGLGWDSALELWAVKTGRKKIEITPKQEKVFWLGHKMEPIVADLFTQYMARENRVMEGFKRVNQVWSHETISWALASPDYMFTDELGIPVIAEMKSSTVRMVGHWSQEQAPNAAHCQLLWQLGVSGFESYGYCVALIGQDVDRFFAPKFPFERYLWNMMLEKAEAFIKCVKEDTPPEIRGSDLGIVGKVLGEPHTHDLLELPGAAMAVAQELERKHYTRSKIDAESAKLTNDINDLKAKLYTMLNGHSIGVVGDFVISVREIKRKEYTVQANSRTELRVKRNTGQMED
jgi:predicted phage-related endonuclease